MRQISIASSAFILLHSCCRSTILFPQIPDFCLHVLAQAWVEQSNTEQADAQTYTLMANPAEHICRFCALQYPETQGRVPVPRQTRCCDATLAPELAWNRSARKTVWLSFKTLPRKRLPLQTAESCGQPSAAHFFSGSQTKK